MTNLFYGRAEKGKIVWSNNKSINDYLCSVEGKPILIKIDREKTKRTLNQNAYYYFYLRIIANETGNHEKTIHELFKRLFLPPRIIEGFGYEVKIPSSTTELAKHEFGEYLDKICSLTNVPLPDQKDVQNIVNIEYPENNLEPKI